VTALDGLGKDPVWPQVLEAFASARQRQAAIFLAGNGGSAANANHLATDLIYGANIGGKGAFRVHALSANSSVLTCLGNDTGYENVFANQLEALAQAGDLLLVFSGSGNSPNILRTLETARRLKILSISFLGFDGGRAKSMSDLALHFPVHDMQVAEDLHMIAGHLMLKALQ
jgi:D-sedoheptulose 7-phosphate isomerase